MEILSVRKKLWSCHYSTQKPLITILIKKPSLPKLKLSTGNPASTYPLQKTFSAILTFFYHMPQTFHLCLSIWSDSSWYSKSFQLFKSHLNAVSSSPSNWTWSLLSLKPHSTFLLWCYLSYLPLLPLVNIRKWYDSYLRSSLREEIAS